MDKVITNREEKGKEIALKSDLIRVSDYHYRVHSQTTKREYDVIKVNDKWQCNYPDHVYRHVCCKHAHAVEFSLKIREEVRQKNAITIEAINPSRCPKCLSEQIVKHGIRHNKYGDIQRFSCNTLLSCDKNGVSSFLNFFFSNYTVTYTKARYKIMF